MYKIRREHRCTTRHRTYVAFAKCVWPRAEWISGDGAFATVSHCPHVEQPVCTTVSLHRTRGDAEQALELMNTTDCGGRCMQRHELVELSI